MTTVSLEFYLLTNYSRLDCQLFKPVGLKGFCLVIPKHIWQQHKFSEVQPYEDRKHLPNMLGVDNDWTNRIRAAGIPVLRMDGLYLYHNYRLLTNSKDHLQ